MAETFGFRRNPLDTKPPAAPSQRSIAVHLGPQRNADGSVTSRIVHPTALPQAMNLPNARTTRRYSW